MAVSRREFLAKYPDFEPASKTMIDEALADAVKNVDPEIFGEKTDQAVALLAAHYLALQPFGKQARLREKDGSTTYGTQFFKLARSMTPGFRVA